MLPIQTEDHETIPGMSWANRAEIGVQAIVET
jgi:hypothetical protein